MLRLPAELIPTIPEPARAVLRDVVWRYGTATSSLRRLPDFLVLGAQKAGTTSLYAYLRAHPEVLGPSWKEVSYFDRHYARGERWYRGHFPTAARAGLVRRRNGREPSVGEASPSYLLHPAAPERVARLVPDARLIVLVRDPVERAYSHYQHEVALGREPLPFEQALAQEEVRMSGELERMLAEPAYFSHAWWNYTYLARGRYAEQLERWLAVFPRERLLIVPSEDLLERTAETYALVLDFLGLRPHELRSYPRLYARSYSEMSPGTRELLADSFAEPNRRLYELLGRDLGWS